MEIKINRNIFIKKIRMLSKVLKDNKVKPILSKIFAEVKNGKLVFTATNLETTINTSMEIEELIEEGKITLDFIIIDEYLKELKDDFILIKSKEMLLEIKSSDSISEFSMLNPEDFPNVFENVDLNEDGIEMEVSKFISNLEKVIISANISSGDIALSSVRLEKIDNTLRFVTTDTFRLTYLEDKIDSNVTDFAKNIDLDAVLSLIKILKNEDKDKKILILFKDSKVYFKTDEMLLTSKLVELTFPDYEKILKMSTYNKILKMKNEELTSLLKRVLVFVRTNNDSKNGATFNFENNKINVSGINEIAKINESLDADFQGDALKIALNVKYILDFLQFIDKDDTVVVELFKINSSIKIYNEKDKSYNYTLMPLALRD